MIASQKITEPVSKLRQMLLFPLFHQFLNLRLLTNTISQVVQLRTSYLTSADYFDLFNVGRVNRPSLFHANPVGGFPYSESFSGACSLSLKNHAFKNLDSFSVSFLDLAVYLHGIAYIKIRYFLELFIFDTLDQFVHINNHFLSMICHL